MKGEIEVIDAHDQMEVIRQNGKGARLARSFCRGVLWFVLAGVVVAALMHELSILRTSTPGMPYPMFIYHSMPVPGTSPVGGAAGAAGADFSQVYTSALALRHGQSAYHPSDPQFMDRFGRASGLPPITNWLYVPLSFLPYWDALLAHSLLSIFALIAAAAFVLERAGLRRHIAPVLLAQLGLYFLTPIGATHLERAQFDLFTAAALTLCVSCALLPQPRWYGVAILAGLLGALKWTALPFLGCFSAFGFLLGAQRRRLGFFLIPAIALLATIAFWPSLTEYWGTIRKYEIDAKPTELTLQHFLPRFWARALPVLTTLVVIALVLWRHRAERERMMSILSLPVALTLLCLSMGFGTISHEYHSIAALGLIPGIVLWSDSEVDLDHRIKVLVCALFGLLLAVAFRGFDQLVRLPPRAMAGAYALAALAFFAVGVHLVLTTKPKDAPSSRASVAQ